MLEGRGHSLTCTASREAARPRVFTGFTQVLGLTPFLHHSPYGEWRLPDVTDRNFTLITPGFFVSAGSMGVLGRTTYPGLPVSTYRRPMAVILPQTVWR